MADRERRMTPPFGGVFVATSTILDEAQVHRALTRISHEIIEKNRGLEDIVLVALQTGGAGDGRRLLIVIGKHHEAQPQLFLVIQAVGTKSLPFGLGQSWQQHPC